MKAESPIIIKNKFTFTQDLINSIHELADSIRSNMLNEIKFIKVSILFDTRSRWGKHYQYIVIYTIERLYLYSIMATVNSKA